MSHVSEPKLSPGELSSTHASNQREVLDAAPVSMWGLDLAPLTFEETLLAVDRMIASRRPGYFITANLHYAMLSNADGRLADVNRDATFLVADGMPMVWYSKLCRRRLPQRVAGSDLIYALCQRAAERGYRVFFLARAPGVADAAAARLCHLYPGLTIAGVEAPPFRDPTPEETARLIARIRESRSDLLFAALGQPKGELWIHQHFRQLDCAGLRAGRRLVRLCRRRRSPRSALVATPRPGVGLPRV